MGTIGSASTVDAKRSEEKEDADFSSSGTRSPRILLNESFRIYVD